MSPMELEFTGEVIKDRFRNKCGITLKLGSSFPRRRESSIISDSRPSTHDSRLIQDGSRVKYEMTGGRDFCIIKYDWAAQKKYTSRCLAFYSVK